VLSVSKARSIDFVPDGGSSFGGDRNYEHCALLQRHGIQKTSLTMNKHYATKILALISPMLISACTIGSTPRETDLGTHHITVRPYCRSASTHTETRTEKGGEQVLLSSEYKCGDTTILLRGEDLTVDGKSYGTLKLGDTIAVNSGRVAITSSDGWETRYR
jgi:hypothetical protein